MHQHFSARHYTGCCTKIFAQSVIYTGHVDSYMDFSSLGLQCMPPSGATLAVWCPMETFGLRQMSILSSSCKNYSKEYLFLFQFCGYWDQLSYNFPKMKCSKHGMNDQFAYLSWLQLSSIASAHKEKPAHQILNQVNACICNLLFLWGCLTTLYSTM